MPALGPGRPSSPCGPGCPAARRWRELVRLLQTAAESELEIWGCVQVLRGPGMPPFVQQRVIAVGGKGFRLDAAYEEVLLGVEMDGAAWHGSQSQRERGHPP